MNINLLIQDVWYKRSDTVLHNVLCYIPLFYIFFMKNTHIFLSLTSRKIHTVQRILWSIYSLGAGFNPYCRRFEFKLKCNFRLSRHAAFTVNTFSANMGPLLFNFNWAIRRIFHPTSALRIQSCPRFPTHNLKNKNLFDQQHCIETANTVWHIPSLSYLIN